MICKDHGAFLLNLLPLPKAASGGKAVATYDNPIYLFDRDLRFYDCFATGRRLGQLLRGLRIR